MTSREKLALALLTALAFALRCYHLGENSLWIDEVLTLERAKKPVGSLIQAVAHINHPPLYFLMMKGWCAMAGFSEAALRFPSALFGTLSVPLAFEAGRRMFSKPAAWIAAAFITIAPYQIYYAQEARAYTLVVCCMFVHMAALHHLLFDNRSQNTAWWFFVASGTIGMYSHFVFIPFFISGVLLGLAAYGMPSLRFEHRLAFRQWGLAVLSILTLFASWLHFAPSQTTRLPQYTQSSVSVTPDIFFAHALSVFSFLPLPYPEIRPFQLCMALLLGAVAIVFFTTRLRAAHDTDTESQGHRWSWGWLWLPFLVWAVIAFAAQLPPKSRYFISTVPGITLAVGCMLAGLRPRLLQVTMQTILTCLLALFLGTIYYARPVKPPWQQVADAMLEHIHPSERYVLLADDGGSSLRHYLRNTVLDPVNRQPIPPDQRIHQPAWEVHVDLPLSPLANPSHKKSRIDESYRLRRIVRVDRGILLKYFIPVDSEEPTHETL